MYYILITSNQSLLTMKYLFLVYIFAAILLHFIFVVTALPSPRMQSVCPCLEFNVNIVSHSLQLQCLELVPALITPTRVALLGTTVKQLMVTVTVVQTAMPSATAVKMLTAIHVIEGLRIRMS